MAKLGDLIVRVGADTRGLNSALGNVKKKIRQDSANIRELGMNMSKSLTAPLLGMGALAVKAATDFEFAMAKVQAVSRFTGDEMEMLESQAEQLGATTSRSASDVASLQLELAKLGKTSTEIEQMTEGVLSLSIAFDQELGETARIVGATLQQFGLQASETGTIVDNLAVIFGSSSLDLEKFDTAMRTVGPVASALGLSVEEASAALGILVTAGTDASTAGTALTKSLTTLAQEGMSGAEAIKFLTNNNLSVAQAFEKFGDRAGKIIPILQGASSEFETLTQKQIEGTGAALEARKVLEDTSMGGFDRMTSSVQALGIAFGEVLLPVFNAITEVVAEVAMQLSTMSKTSKTFTLIIGALVAAIGPLLYIMPSLVIQFRAAKTSMLALNASMLTNPYILATAAIVALVAAAVSLANHTGTAADEVRDLRGELAGLESDRAKREASEKQVEEATAAYEEQKKIVSGLKQMMREGDAMDQKMHARSLVRSQESLKLKEEVLEGIVKEHDQLLKTQQMSVLFAKLEATKVKPSIVAVNKEIKEQTQTLGELMTMLEQTASASRDFVDTKEMGMFLNQLSQIQSILSPAQAAAIEAFEALKVQFMEVVEKAENFGSTLGNAFANVVNKSQEIKEALMNGLITPLEAMEAKAENAKNAVRSLVKDAILGLIQMAKVNVIANATNPLNPKNIASGGLAMPALIVAGLSVLEGFVGGLTAFKDGGIVSGPTLGLVGEYPGARTNPEVIAPLDKLRSMMGGQNVVVTGKISGRDILLTSERNAIDRNRVRGF